MNDALFEGLFLAGGQINRALAQGSNSNFTFVGGAQSADLRDPGIVFT